MRTPPVRKARLSTNHSDAFRTFVPVIVVLVFNDWFHGPQSQDAAGVKSFRAALGVPLSERADAFGELDVAAHWIG